MGHGVISKDINQNCDLKKPMVHSRCKSFSVRNKDLCITPVQHEIRAAPAWAGAARWCHRA